jgi:vacuolar protein sorting-associated protein VTA1
MVYTTNLMDKLEQVKADNSTNDAIQDDVAAQAYVEQFAMEILNKADTVMRDDRVAA